MSQSLDESRATLGVFYSIPDRASTLNIWPLLPPTPTTLPRPFLSRLCNAPCFPALSQVNDRGSAIPTVRAHPVSDLPAWSSSSRGSAAPGPSSQSFRGGAVRVSDASPIQKWGHSVCSQIGILSAPHHVEQPSMDLPRSDRRVFRPFSLRSNQLRLPVESMDFQYKFHALSTESYTDLGRFCGPSCTCSATSVENIVRRSILAKIETSQ